MFLSVFSSFRFWLEAGRLLGDPIENTKTAESELFVPGVEISVEETKKEVTSAIDIYGNPVFYDVKIKVRNIVEEKDETEPDNNAEEPANPKHNVNPDPTITTTDGMVDFFEKEFQKLRFGNDSLIKYCPRKYSKH